MKRLLLPVLLVLLSVSNVCSQLFVYQQYTVEDGLSHNLVYRIFQHEPTGYVWFGTESGLDRFNGNSIKSFSADISVRQAVLAICEANPEALHVGLFESGVFQIDVLQNRAATISSSDIKRAIKLRPGPNGSVIALTSNSRYLLKFSPSGKADTLFSTSHQITDFAQDADDHIYVATAGGMVVLDAGAQLLQTIPLKEALVAVRWIDHEVWLASTRSIGRLGTKGEWQPSINISNGDHIRDFLIDRTGACWIATERGSLLYHDQNQTIDVGKRVGVESLTIQDLAEDSDGNVWLATRGEGVFKFDVIRAASGYSGLPRESLYLETGTQLPDGTLIIGGDNVLLACKDGKCHSLTSNFPDKWLYVYDALTRGDEAIISTNIGVFRYQTLNKPLERLTDAVIVSVAADSEGKLVFCSLIGEIFALEEGGSLSKLFQSDSRVHTSIFRNDQLWVFFDSAAYINDGHKTFLLKYPENFLVNEAAADQFGTVWCATNRGLFSFGSGGWVKFTEEDGITGKNYLSMALDSAGNLWLGNATSIECRLTDGSVKTIVASHTLNRHEVGLLLADQAGNLHVGSSNKFFTLRAPFLEHFRSSSRLVVTHLAIGEELVNSASSEYWSVDHDKGSFEVHFDLVDLSDWQGTKVEFRLLPLVDEWTEVQNMRLRFNELAPNNYHFELRSHNQQHNGVTAALNVDFTVNPPWWSGVWGRLGGLVAAMALIGLLLKWINDFQRNRYQQRMDLELLKMRALNNHLHPHFLSNALNSIKHLLRSDKTPAAIRYISEFAYLMRKNLEHQEQNCITIKEEVTMLTAYLSIEQLRFENHFHYDIAVDESIDINARIPFMIVQPFVENAIWHGLLPMTEKKTGRVEVTFLKTNDDHRFKIVVRDNGVGYNPGHSSIHSSVHSSSGISMSERRIKMMDKQAQLCIRSRQTDATMTEDGTEVLILISMKKIHSKIDTFVLKP